MATIHVREVPDDLYGRIRELASAENRTLDAEVVTLLERAVRDEARAAADGEAWARYDELIESIRRLRYRHPEGTTVPESVELIREDRAR
jgi:plasmid stability protein